MKFLFSVVTVSFLLGGLLFSCKTSNDLKFRNSNKHKDYKKEISIENAVNYSYDSMKNVLENHIQQTPKEIKIKVY